jgi:hypothetical protein
VKGRDNRVALAMRSKSLKRRRFRRLETGWKVAGKWLAFFED